MAGNSYFPEVWKDDDRMAGLMSMFKLRNVNPHDWETKMTFWSDMIDRSCRQLGDPVISLGALKSRFRRDDRIPAGLNTVLEHLIKTREILPVEECLKGTEGWLSWGVNSLLTRPVSWLFGASQADAVTTDQFVHVETVKEMAAKILQRQSEQIVDDDSLIAGVVEYAHLRAQASDICKTQLAFDLAANQLLKDGAITIGTSSAGEKIVKFRDVKDKGPVRLTETDTNIHDVRRALNKLEKDISKMDDSIKKCENEARLCLRKGNKNKAKQMLRQKLLLLKQIKEKDGQYEKLLNIMHRLAQTREQKDILDAYQAGVSAFKQNLDRHGLSASKIDETMEDINEALSDHEDISMALSQGPSGVIGGIDSDDLEQELNDLLAEGDRVNDERHLPQVPIEEPEFEPEERPQQPRDRLKDLRRQLERAT
uniref:Charged multivesicular body protein 7 n=1 Tax=Plectus sambesii TaxID=2011161 RepID=A0A914WT14_9BILA